MIGMLRIAVSATGKKSPKRFRKPQPWISMPTMGQPHKTSKIPPMKHAVPLALRHWKKNLYVFATPMMSMTPAMNSICKGAINGHHDGDSDREGRQKAAHVSHCQQALVEEEHDAQHLKEQAACGEADANLTVVVQARCEEGGHDDALGGRGGSRWRGVPIFSFPIHTTTRGLREHNAPGGATPRSRHRL